MNEGEVATNEKPSQQELLHLRQSLASSLAQTERLLMVYYGMQPHERLLLDRGERRQYWRLASVQNNLNVPNDR